jgi:hypothetical protein
MLQLWCWISDEWDFLRIAAFYAPIWLCILLTSSIYIRAGKVIFARQREVHHLDASEREVTEVSQLGNGSAMRVTEIHITTERAESRHGDESRRNSTVPRTSRPSRPSRPKPVRVRRQPADPAYSVTVETDDGFGTRYVPLGQLDDKVVSSRPLRRATRTDRNAAARAYTKYAMLYFVALLVTWVSLPTCFPL